MCGLRIPTCSSEMVLNMKQGEEILGTTIRTCSLLAESYKSYRLNKPFTPPKATLKEVHDAVPKHLLTSEPL